MCGDNNCIECENYRTCTKCREGTELLDGSCIEACEAGFYRSEDNPNRGCYECDSNCNTCSKKSNQCTSCSALNKFINQDNSCELCHESCASCSDRNTCLTCVDGYKKGESKCFKCDSDQFINGDKCQSCGPNCLSCVNGPKDCQMCGPNSALTRLGTCECDKGFFFDQAS